MRPNLSHKKIRSYLKKVRFLELIELALVTDSFWSHHESAPNTD